MVPDWFRTGSRPFRNHFVGAQPQVRGGEDSLGGVVPEPGGCPVPRRISYYPNSRGSLTRVNLYWFRNHIFKDIPKSLPPRSEGVRYGSENGSEPSGTGWNHRNHCHLFSERAPWLPGFPVSPAVSDVFSGIRMLGTVLRRSEVPRSVEETYAARVHPFLRTLGARPPRQRGLEVPRDALRGLSRLGRLVPVP